MKFLPNELKFFWPFYLSDFLGSILYFAPAFTVVYFTSLGFSLAQTGIFVSIMSLTIILSEVPTGIFADLYGRKNSTLLGFVIEGIAFLGLFYATDFFSIAILHALWGFGVTFSSGAGEAWITDLAQNKNLVKEFFIKMNFIEGIGFVASGILGAYLVQRYGVRSAFLVGAIGYLVSIIVLLFARERKIHHKHKKAHKQFKKASRYIVRNRGLLLFLVASVFVIAGTTFHVGLSWIPLLQDFGFPDHAFGYMWSAVSFVGAIAPLIVRRFTHSEARFMSIMIALWGIAALAIAFATNLVFVFVILLLTAFFDFGRKPTERTYFQSLIPSKLRATLGSFESVLLMLVGVILGPVAGYSVDVLGPKITIMIAGVLLLPAAGIFWWVDRIKQ